MARTRVRGGGGANEYRQVKIGYVESIQNQGNKLDRLESSWNIQYDSPRTENKRDSIKFLLSKGQ